MTEALFHVGIVVPDLEEARARLTASLGLQWGPIIDVPALEVTEADGTAVVVPNHMCYSAEEPYLELIQEVPGTVWTTNPFSNLHHIGFFSEDLAGDSQRMVGAGCPLQLAGRNGQSTPVSFTYHADPLGFRFELVDASMREALGFLTGGASPPGQSSSPR